MTIELQTAASREKVRKAPLAPWHILTPEYPPQMGGVSDYTSLVADGLANAGDEVHVWGPNGISGREAPGVFVHDDLGGFGPQHLLRTGRLLNTFSEPRRLLVQWVPHGFGFRSMNLPLCLWLWDRSVRHGDHVEITFHEAYLPFSGSWRQAIAAAVHRAMTVILLQAARRAWVTIPAWEGHLRPYALGRRISFEWLPVPNNIPVEPNPGAESQIRQRYRGRRRLLLGHFGTHGGNVTRLLEQILPALFLQRDDAAVLLMGRGSKEFCEKLVWSEPWLSDRVHTTESLAAVDLSHHISACDLMLQPYPDGISTRRGSAMAALAHGRPVVTTTGHNSEAFWISCDAVAITPVSNTDAYVATACRLLDDEQERTQLGERARLLYETRFDIRHVVTALRTTRIENETCGS